MEYADTLTIRSSSGRGIRGLELDGVLSVIIQTDDGETVDSPLVQLHDGTFGGVSVCRGRIIAIKMQSPDGPPLHCDLRDTTWGVDAGAPLRVESFEVKLYANRQPSYEEFMAAH